MDGSMTLRLGKLSLLLCRGRYVHRFSNGSFAPYTQFWAGWTWGDLETDGRGKAYPIGPVLWGRLAR